MLTLFVLIILGVLIYKEGEKKNISSASYILTMIVLAISASILIYLAMGGTIAGAVFGAIVSISVACIPYNMIKNKPSNHKESDFDY